jgi:hypothetical protein
MKKIESVEELEALSMDSVILGIVPDGDEDDFPTVWQKFDMKGSVWYSPNYNDSYSSDQLMKTVKFLKTNEYYLLWTPEEEK